MLGASTLLSMRHAGAEEGAAERLFHEGRALVVEGRFAEACPRLEESQRLEPRLGTQLNVAFCQERLGKLATAWRGFQQALQAARASGDRERERFAQAHVDALAPRVPWLRTRATADANVRRLALQLDGEPLASSAWDTELPVDPGEHTLVARHDESEYWRTTVVLRESEHVVVAVPAAPEGAAEGVEGVEGVEVPRDAPEAGHFVYEIGAFVGLMFAATKQSEPKGTPSIRSVVVNEDGTSQVLSCDTVACYYLPIDSAGLMAGATGFVGYAATSETHLGLRFLVGPRVGGGAIAALGPSVSFRLSERFNVGPTVLFGTASHSAQGLVGLDARAGLTELEYDDETELQGSLGFSVGVGADVGMRLVGGASGSVVLQAMPSFLLGAGGNAWAIPVGVAWRWR